MTQNFKKTEVTGYTKEEALSNAPFQVIRDATQAWKAAGKPITEKELNAFCAGYLAKHTKMAPGVGCAITFEAGTANTRENPCKIVDIKNEKGKRKYRTGYQGRDKATKEILFTTYETKSKAKETAKKLFQDGYKGDIMCVYVKDVIEGEVGAFEANYTPSKSAKLGKYIVFGVEA